MATFALMLIILTSLVIRTKFKRILALKWGWWGWFEQRQKNNLFAAIYEYGLYMSTQGSGYEVCVLWSTWPPRDKGQLQLMKETFSSLYWSRKCVWFWSKDTAWLRFIKRAYVLIISNHTTCKLIENVPNLSNSIPFLCRRTSIHLEESFYRYFFNSWSENYS